LDNLFRLVGPCVILVDELVNYARNADLDTIGTFVQNLTEAVNGRDNVALIVTLPVTATEAGGPRGMEAMGVLENILNRMQAVTQVAQASNDEAFAVVRRRLFQEDYDEAARDETCRAFYRMYQRGPGDYPPEARETRYLERLRECYPIHPEIFDRLYEDWSMYHQFQRTRGVLRMMARTISRLYADGDTSPMIMPGNLPFSEGAISEEFVRLLGPQWDAVMGEVDRENSRTHTIDRQKPERFGSVGGAARRTARAVFLGSATQKAVRGVTARQVNLGVVSPGHGTAVYAEAIHAMDGELYHFYRGNDSRYYFDSEENLNKVANDRAAELGNEALDSEIIRRVNEFNQRSVNRAVIACPQSPADVRDEDFVRLVILRPNQPRPSRSAEHDHASEAAKAMLSTCGDEVRRTRPNTLLFLAASSDGVRETRSAARRFLSWDSIINGNRRVPNLTGDRQNQSRSQQQEANPALDNSLASAYRWIMAPSQPDPQSAEYDTGNWRQISAQADIAANALQRFVADEFLVDTLAPEALNRRLQERLWNGPNPRYHVTVDELWDLLTRNVYLGLRLRNRQVLEQCLDEGIRAGIFGRADGYDAATDEYRNLMHGIRDSSATYQIAPLTGSTLIVEPDVAQLHLEEGPVQIGSGVDDGDPPPVPEPPPQPKPTPTPEPRLPRRLVARKTVAQQDAVSYDFNATIRDEIARVMVAAGCSVVVEVTVTVSKEDGISENVARSMRNNSRMLGIDLEDDLTD
jgi:RNAse (barnase) inhibitor barstar